MDDLTGKTAVVTGAGGGIGRAVAGALARMGANVVLADIDEDRAAKEAGELGESALPVKVDVADEASVVALGETAVEQFGGIDIWVNNAGVIRPALLTKMAVEDYDKVMDVHARGCFLGVREAARRMIEHERKGVILNVTSTAGLDGTIGQINYSAAKGAIVSITKSAARELGRHDIRVNAVAPMAATEMTEKVRTDENLAPQYLAKIPLGYWAEPELIAEVFGFLASPGARYMTGQVVCVDGGTYMAS